MTGSVESEFRILFLFILSFPLSPLPYPLSHLPYPLSPLPYPLSLIPNS